MVKNLRCLNYIFLDFYLPLEYPIPLQYHALCQNETLNCHYFYIKCFGSFLIVDILTPLKLLESLLTVGLSSHS